MARTKTIWEGGYILDGVYYLARLDRFGVYKRRSTGIRVGDNPAARAERLQLASEEYTKLQRVGWLEYLAQRDAEPAVSGILALASKYVTWVATLGGKHGTGVTAEHARGIASTIARFADYAASQGVTEVPQITVPLMESWRVHRMRNPVPMTQIVGYDQAGEPIRKVVEGVYHPPIGKAGASGDAQFVKQFCRWCYRNKLIDAHPLEHFTVPRAPGKSKKPFPVPVADWLQVRAHIPERYQLAGDILINTGLRYSALRRLDPNEPGEVNVSDKTIWLPAQKMKASKPITIPVSDATILAIIRLKELPPLPESGKHFRDHIKRAGKLEGVRHWGIHCFRHSWASHAFKNGMSLFKIQERLGHSHVGITDRYLRDIGAASETVEWTGPLDAATTDDERSEVDA